MEETLCKWFDGTFEAVHKRLKRPVKLMIIKPIKVKCEDFSYSFNALFQFTDVFFIGNWDDSNSEIKEIYKLEPLTDKKELTFYDSNCFEPVVIKVRG